MLIEKKLDEISARPECFLGHPSDTLHRRLSFKVVGFRYALSPERNFVCLSTFYGNPRNVCITAGTISTIFRDMAGFFMICWPVGLLTELQVLSHRK
jgi:hypothetical protein